MFNSRKKLNVGASAGGDHPTSQFRNDEREGARYVGLVGRIIAEASQSTRENLTAHNYSVLVAPLLAGNVFCSVHIYASTRLSLVIMLHRSSSKILILLSVIYKEAHKELEIRQNPQRSYHSPQQVVDRVSSRAR
jgi:hypothetical protein